MTKGEEEVTKENVFVAVLEWSLDLRIGWESWSFLRAVWRSETSSALEESRAKTAMPVPPGTALHQLCSVSPTDRPLVSSILADITWQQK